MDKIVKISFSEEATRIYAELSSRAQKDKKSRVLLKSIDQKLDFIRKDKHYGNPMAKNLFPKEYVENYYVRSLFRVELPFFWRMLYTLRDNRIEIIAFVLDIVDHKRYDKKFNYG
jgi:hypothetical protein